MSEAAIQGDATGRAARACGRDGLFSLRRTAGNRPDGSDRTNGAHSASAAEVADAAVVDAGLRGFWVDEAPADMIPGDEGYEAMCNFEEPLDGLPVADDRAGRPYQNDSDERGISVSEGRCPRCGLWRVLVRLLGSDSDRCCAGCYVRGEEKREGGAPR